eukprot:TRINITY_DN6533_c0_g2_i1.p1 TRINITY_DN6533_c0_g2~~TRINITY_DN6533_c0_g2_i1.p1  ORF type:complete len:545 (+),score=229.48 TRINITY_DN6533_c0_g2_i1:56-1636(+)
MKNDALKESWDGMQPLLRIEPSPERSKFFRDVRRAFQMCAAQLVALLLITVLYFNYRLIEDLSTPFFWAFIISILLKKVKTFFKNALQPLDKFENESGWLKSIPKKLWYTVTKSKAFLQLLVICCISTKILQWTFGEGQILFYVLLGFLILSVLTILLFCVTSSKSNESVLSILIVVGFSLLIVGTVSFIAFHVLSETKSFVMDMKTMIQEIMEDPILHDKLEQLGITTAAANQYVDMGYRYGKDWIEEKGYDIAQVEEFVFASKNSTDTALTVAQNFLSDFDTSRLSTVYDTISIESLTSIGGTVIGYVVASSASVLMILSQVMSSLVLVANSAIDVVVFFGALFFLISTNDHIVERIFELLPVPKENQIYMSDTIRSHISQVFLCSFLLCISHGFVGWLLLRMMDSSFSVSGGILIGSMTLFPFLSPYIIFIPALLMAFVQNNPATLVYGITILLSQIGLSNLDAFFYQMIPNSHPYITGLVMVLGFAKFGFSGVVVGPLLFVVLKTTHRLFCVNLAENRIHDP